MPEFEIKSSDFKRFGTAKEAIADAIQKINDAGGTAPYNLRIHPAQYRQLASNTLSTGENELKIIENTLKGGKIIITSCQSYAKVEVRPTSKNIVCIITIK